MSEQQPKNPLHGITLKQILSQLVDHYGWQKLAAKVPINCFSKNPTLNSSLKLLRKTPWAREKVERLYIATFAAAGRGKKR
ncbi:VF530 family protein [Desulfogranum mediterraneum]|uniref:VF530 family protein n=1 Tax=Desulfogranum mediterraneum TaxID=160661 RepID=UPI0003F4F30D|nr:VF530 family protein [Desulfogranum mediterraneum]